MILAWYALFEFRLKYYLLPYFYNKKFQRPKIAFFVLLNCLQPKSGLASIVDWSKKSSIVYGQTRIKVSNIPYVNGSLEPGEFRQVPDVMRINIYNSNIRRIQHGVFMGLPKLNFLLLWRCEITHIISLDSVSTTLKYLDLSFNRLHALPKDIFENFLSNIFKVFNWWKVSM